MQTNERTFIKMPAALTTAIKQKCEHIGSNEFEFQIDCKRQFTALEEKVFLAMLQIGFEFSRLDSDNKTFRVYFSNIRKMFPSLNGYNNDDLEAAANAFFESSIKITVPASGATEAKVFDEKLGEFIYAKFHIVTKMVRFSDGVEFTFNDELLKIIFTDNSFAKLSIDDLNAIGSSAYAIPLYGFSKRYENIHKTKKITLQFLRQLLGIADDSYTEYKHFKQKVLDRIIKEINEKTSISIVPKPIKGGKKVIGLYFEVRKKKCKSDGENSISTKAKKLKDTVMSDDSLVDNVNATSIPELNDTVEEAGLDFDYAAPQITRFVEAAFAQMSKGKDANYRKKIEQEFHDGDERTVDNVFNRILERFDIELEELRQTVDGYVKNYFSIETKILAAFYRKDGMVVIEEENIRTKVKNVFEVDYKSFVDSFGRGELNELFRKLQKETSIIRCNTITKN